VCEEAIVTDQPAMLVVSAHAADFVWRASGAIASFTRQGGRAHVVCLTYGEKGESQGLWKQPGMTLETVKARRHEEASTAAAVLGAEIEFFDLGDYPIRATDELYDGLVATMRRVRPDVILTHPAHDPYNLDHSLVHEVVLRARMIAQAAGHDPATRPIGAPQVLQFEPHQPEQCGFKPDLLLDVSDVFPLKRKAMEAMEGAQGHLVAYYDELGERRGVQARRNGGAGTITHAEAYQRVFPTVAGSLR
jgi:4-oxalomesaconate hydratase